MSASVHRLGERRVQYRDPMAELNFAAADSSRPWLPYELLSVANLPEAAHFSDAQRRRLSEVEFSRLCAAGLWLEGLLISRVTAGARVAASADEARIVLQEVREEAGHGLMFIEMIERARLTGVALLGPTRLLSWVARRLDPREAPFWAMVYIGESVTNQFVARALQLASDSPICPLVRQVMALHHREEAHHIAAARTLLAARIDAMGWVKRRAFAVTFDALLRRFLEATLYPTPASLAAAGVFASRRVALAVRACPARRALAHDCAAPALRFLERTGLLRAARRMPKARG